MEEFENPEKVWGRCHGGCENAVLEVEGKKIVPWNCEPPIPDFFYSWSHMPAYMVKIPKGCFTITILRDPIQRFISLFRFLCMYKYLKVPIPKGHFNLGRFVREDILSTAYAFPPRYCLGQLYHFSPEGDINEAIEEIGRLSYVIRTERFEEGLMDLRKTLSLRLPHLHCKEDGMPEVEREIVIQMIPQVLEELREVLAPGYELLQRMDK
jgi:hypothetical protein